MLSFGGSNCQTVTRVLHREMYGPDHRLGGGRHTGRDVLSFGCSCRSHPSEAVLYSDVWHVLNY